MENLEGVAYETGGLLETSLSILRRITLESACEAKKPETRPPTTAVELLLGHALANRECARDVWRLLVQLEGQLGGTSENQVI